MLIDSDVHEMLQSEEQLVPYLKEDFYIETIRDRGWRMERPFPFVQPTLGGLDRADAKPQGGGPGGSDRELLTQHVFEEGGASYAVLNGLFYPTTMQAWPDFAVALASAYNDWLIDNWLSKDQRLLGSVQVAAQAPESAAREIERVGSHPQFVQVMLPLCQFRYGDSRFTPIFAAAERQGLPVAFHNCMHTPTTHGYFNYFIEWHTAICQSWMSQIISLISNGVFDRHPSLMTIMPEAGFTWVPHLMSRFDQQWRQLVREVPWVKQAPSSYIRERVRFTTHPMEEMPVERCHQVIEWMGSDKLLLYSSDYPHWDYDPAEETIKCLPEDLRRKILVENAAEFYGLEVEGRDVGTPAEEVGV